MTAEPPPVAAPPPVLELPLGATLRAGMGAGLIGGAAMAAVLALVGEIAGSGTPVEGIRTSTWTGITAVAALVFGRDAVHGDFHVGAIAAGLGLLLLGSALLGAVGALLVVVCLGARPERALALATGLAYGLVLQVVLVDVLANGLQGDDLLSRSGPPGAWWAAFATYGAVLGLACARRCARTADRIDAQATEARA